MVTVDFRLLMELPWGWLFGTDPGAWGRPHVSVEVPDAPGPAKRFTRRPRASFHRAVLGSSARTRIFV